MSNYIFIKKKLIHLTQDGVNEFYGAHTMAVVEFVAENQDEI